VYTRSTQQLNRYIIWVPSYAHLMLLHCDYLLCDGSHGFGKYGWKWVPLSIVTSTGWTVPMGAVFGMEEDTSSLLRLLELIREHCRKQGVECPQFHMRKPECTLSASIAVAPEQTDTSKRDHMPQSSECTPSAAVTDKTEVRKWAAENFRTFIYPPNWEEFLVKLVQKECDEDVSKCIPPTTVMPPTFHTDSGSAFICLLKFVDWNRTSCAKHMEANVTSSDQETKDLTKMLLYGREISVHMATDMSASLLTKVAAKSMLSSTREWFTKSFSTEEGMKVCQWWVHTYDVHTHTTIFADQHPGASQFFVHMRLQC
jgi:hypothetical protein